MLSLEEKYGNSNVVSIANTLIVRARICTEVLKKIQEKIYDLDG